MSAPVASVAGAVACIAGRVQAPLRLLSYIIPAGPSPGFQCRGSRDNSKAYMLHHEHLCELLDAWAFKLAWSFR